MTDSETAMHNRFELIIGSLLQRLDREVAPDAMRDIAHALESTCTAYWSYHVTTQPGGRY